VASACGRLTTAFYQRRRPRHRSRRWSFRAGVV